MGSHLVVDPVVATLVEKVQVVVRQQRVVVANGTGCGFRGLVHKFSNDKKGGVAPKFALSVPNWRLFC